MIFDKLIMLKILLDTYKKSKNPFKKLIYHIRLKNILDEIDSINNTIISIELLSEWHKFINIADPENINNIYTESYTYSEDRYAEEIIIKRDDDIGDIYIILKFKNNSIDIEYPIRKNFRINKVYKDKIDDTDIIRDKNTVTINDSIRKYIHNFTISYMKGEFDNVW